jgi:hypothetical protein
MSRGVFLLDPADIIGGVDPFLDEAARSAEIPRYLDSMKQVHPNLILFPAPEAPISPGTRMMSVDGHFVHFLKFSLSFAGSANVSGVLG